MKRSLVLKGLIALLIVLIFAFSAVSCIDLGGLGGGGNDGITVDKDALLEELESEISSQGDYTADSYADYVEALKEAKRVANDDEATQKEVDSAADALEDARQSLAIRPVKEVTGANKSFSLLPGDEKVIALADYVNENGLSKITYSVNANSTAVSISGISGGRFTITANELDETTDLTVSIIVSYNGVEKLKVDLAVKVVGVAAPTLNGSTYDKTINVEKKGNITIDFAENVNNSDDLALVYSAKRGNIVLTLDGSLYTLDLSDYTDEIVNETFIVSISYTINGEEKTLEYTYNLKLNLLYQNDAYKVANGNFENGLEGWTVISDNGSPFGAIDDKSTFWAQEFPMFNEGKYFSSEGSDKGSLASPYFQVNSKYATFMLGAAGKTNVYITIEDTNGNVLALYRNTKFADLPAGVEDWDEQRQLIGVSVFVCNFVTYKVDISAFEGQSVRFVIHDHEDGNGGFGFVLFDELVTYYPSEDLLPEGATLVENLLADQSALKAEVDCEVREQGDYTDDSYNAYIAKLNEAKAVLGNIALPQQTADRLADELYAARLALVVRPVFEVEGAAKEFHLISGNSKEISLADYINTNSLSNITYVVKADGTSVTLSSIADGKFTVTAGEVSENTHVIVSMIVSHNGNEKLTVELSFKITNQQDPIIRNEEISRSYDIFDLENKENLVIDFAENVDNIGELELVYSVNGTAIEGSVYTFTFGEYSDEITYVSLNVSVSYVANGIDKSVSFIYKLGLTDTRAYRVVNSGFEQGLGGWEFNNTYGEAPFAGIDNKTHYWVQEFPMFNVGSYFSAYADGASEGSQGTLASSYFTVKSAWATYMLGGAGNDNVYITIEDRNGNVLAIYHNDKFADLPADVTDFDAQRELVGNTVFLANFVTYKVDLTEWAGEEIRFVVHDYASANWGVVFFDELVTYYASEDLLPEDAILAEPLDADRSALEAEIALEVAEQGDYTEDSYNAYIAKLGEAKAILDSAPATQKTIDRVAAELYAARLALAVRPVLEVEGANKELNLTSGNSKELNLSDYINTNGLSNISYSFETTVEILSFGPAVDGKFTLTAAEAEDGTLTEFTVVVYYGSEEKLRVNLTVYIMAQVAPTLEREEISSNYDIFDLENKESLVIDFAENVINTGELALTYSVKRGEEAVELNGTEYTLTLGTYAEEYSYTTFTVTISCTVNGEAYSLEYTYTIGIRDTSAYRVVNGNFENGLEGWTFTNTQGEAPFAGIDEKSTFWGEAYPMFNVGKYFSSYADGASEGSHGNLASSYFTVNSNYATYMLGGAGNHHVYITIENEAGEVLALYRNTKFADLPAGDYSLEEKHAMIGNTVFLANFVSYKIDISAFAGQKIRFVVHDYASSGWGVVYFDQLETYHTEEPKGILAENLLASKTALAAELALEVAEQGDYTADSYEAYLARLNAAKSLIDDIVATQQMVDDATAALAEARLALAVRPVLEAEGAVKYFRLTSGNSKEINLADYINTNNLSGITYVLSSNGLVSFGDIVDGKFTITASEVLEASAETLTIKVLYNGEEKLVVEISIEITNDLAPTVYNESLAADYDVYDLENKTSITVDLSANVDNAGNLNLTYSVNGTAVEGSVYTYTLGSYTDERVYETLEITISYVANGEASSISYTYVLGINDSTEYRLVNGGFENGLDGWTVVGNIGNVNSNSHYWVNDPESAEGFAFGMDGEKMFSAYAEGAEERAVGTLTSSSFKLGGTGFVSFKIGAMRDENYVYVDVVDAQTKEILARYYNGLWAERTDDIKSGCTLIAYKADLSEFLGREVFFRISDNADSGYGLFFADSFVTYYENEPEGFNLATAVSYTVSGTIYDLFNGGFEMGNVQGWWNNGEIGVVTNANGYWGDNIPYEKVGDFLFTGVESNGADTMREGNQGTLTSSAFEIGGTGMISFKLGGGGNALCYVQIIDAVTGEILARYHQQAQQDAKLIQYVADLSAYIGRTVRIQVADYASSGWGCVSFDNVVTYYPAGAELPEGHTANDIKYTLTNGSFENGLDAWRMDITAAGAHNTLGWVESSEHDAGWYTKNDDRKDGNNLFTFCRPDGTNCENTKGTLNSSTFVLKKNSYISFRFGGAGTRDVHIQLVKADGTVIATFYNEAEGKINTEMFAYYYQYTGEDGECFFRVVDNSESNYGCFVVDDFRVNLESAPEGFIPAIQ